MKKKLLKHGYDLANNFTDNLAHRLLALQGVSVDSLHFEDYSDEREEGSFDIDRIECKSIDYELPPLGKRLY